MSLGPVNDAVKICSITNACSNTNLQFQHRYSLPASFWELGRCMIIPSLNLALRLSNKGKYTSTLIKIPRIRERLLFILRFSNLESFLHSFYHDLTQQKVHLDSDKTQTQIRMIVIIYIKKISKPSYSSHILFHCPSSLLPRSIQYNFSLPIPSIITPCIH